MPSKGRRTFSFKDVYYLLRGMSVVMIIMRMRMKEGVRMRMPVGACMTVVRAGARSVLGAPRAATFGRVC